LKFENDWRKNVPDYRVVNQFRCSAYAITAITVQELMQYEMSAAVGKDEMQYLSVQQILDCNPYVSCSAGEVKEAWLYSKAYGTSLESEYGFYEGADGSECKKKGEEVASRVSDFGYIWYDENDKNDDMVARMSKHLYHKGPLAVHVDGTPASFTNYRSGIVTDDGLDHKEKIQHDHTMALVGQGVDHESGMPYWILQNSWGGDWGDLGSIKIAKKGGKGLFGMNERVQWVELEEGYGLGYSNQAPSKP